MSFLIYGANGFTGRLIAREAARRGEDFILAGRNREEIEALGRELQRPVRVFDLQDSAATREAIRGMSAVLHCAGPFIKTSKAMVDAALAEKVHYLDITGEIAVFERVMARDAEAKAHGVALIPGVGFDVVPTDCLAAELHELMPDAVDLKLAFFSPGARISRGTFRTMIEGLGDGGAVRRGGKIVNVPLDHEVREIEFSCGKRMTMTLPWGDVSSAFYSTAIPDITVYAGRSPREIKRIRRMKLFLPLMRLGFMKRIAGKFADRLPGPDEAARRSNRVYVWGRVSNASGESIERRLSTVEAYEFTARSALAAVKRISEGVAAGALTPSLAFGKDFVKTIEGTEMEPGA
jgi:short subunit dehydrogenase-like uncharacterized protein